jgi:molybdate transport system substrate-binding protein
MKRPGIRNVLAAIALSLALFGLTAGSPANAAEFKLLCAVALHPAMDILIPDFETSSGHKVNGRLWKRGRDRGPFSKG